MKIKASLRTIVCLTFIGVFTACATLVAQEASEPVAVHEQTQQAITVRIEKVTLERIYNSRAWLEAEHEKTKSSKEAFEKFLKRNLPAKLVTHFVSVVGDTKKLGPAKIQFANDVETVAVVSRAFSPPKWQPRLPKLVVAPEANGIETQYLLKGSTQISDVFPARIEVQVTAVNGNELTFVFDNVKF